LYVGLAIPGEVSVGVKLFRGGSLRKSLGNGYMRGKHFSPKINKTSVDGGSIWANFVIPLEAGPECVRGRSCTFGTANWTQFCPGMIIGNPPRRAG
jgi:hypothetical protein